MWEEEVNAGNGESARFDVYYMTFGVAWQQLRLHAKRIGADTFLLVLHVKGVPWLIQGLR